MYEEKYLIQIIKYLLHFKEENNVLPIPAKELNWTELFKIADRHSIGSLLYHVLPEIPEGQGPEEPLKGQMRNLAVRAAAMDIKQLAEKEALAQAFEKQGLFCMPVKGCDTKTYYPRTEWRTMSDLDILYKPEQHKEVKELLLQLGYTDFESGLKHDHYSKPPFISVEMHRGLVAANTMTEDYYEDVWEKTQPREGYKYIYQMTMEEQYIYTMIHLMEHFKEGGVGIRFLMDIYVFSHLEEMDRAYVETTFEKLGLLDFARNIERLSKRWFGNGYVEGSKETEVILDELETFIVNNGIYGQASHARAIALEKEGRMGYIRRVVFPNLNSMKSLYPWLEKKPYLLPAAWGIRMVRTVLFRGRSIRVGIDTVRHGDVNRGRQLQEFYRRCGL